MKMRMLLVGSAVLLLGACGGSDDAGSPGDAETLDEYADAVDAAPECSDVWVAGKNLPSDYEGCRNDAEDLFETPAAVECSDGSILVTYEPVGSGFFTDASGVIVEAGEDYANDPRYAARTAACY